jgi:hyaluronan synthase/N-acetylglucosaminyltransferase
MTHRADPISSQEGNRLTMSSTLQSLVPAVLGERSNGRLGHRDLTWRRPTSKSSHDPANRSRHVLPWFRIVLFAFLPVCIVASLYMFRSYSIGLMSLYGLLSVGRIGGQVITSHWVRQKRYHDRPLPKAAVIVALYNEDQAIFLQSLQTLARQDYPDLDIIVVDDGSKPDPEYRATAELFGARYVRQQNAGKRHAMYTGFSMLSPDTEIVMVADSDTFWKPDAARQMAKVLLSTPNVGAVTGYVGVSNAAASYLTRLVDMRYYMAFQQERASQAYFGTVVCVSGPLGAYRRDVIERIKHPFVTQRFLGKPCTFGDDRHLTNLVLGLGYKVLYAADAHCTTEAPTTLKRYLTQQARWGKSHWREMIWQFKALPLQSIYLSYDWMITLLLPFLLVLSIGHYGYLAVTNTPMHLTYLFGTMVGLSLVRVLEPIRVTRRPIFLAFVLYTAIHLLFMLPLKFYSLATVNRTGWGTR